MDENAETPELPEDIVRYIRIEIRRDGGLNFDVDMPPAEIIGFGDILMRQGEAAFLGAQARAQQENGGQGLTIARAMPHPVRKRN